MAAIDVHKDMVKVAIRGPGAKRGTGKADVPEFRTFCGVLRAMARDQGWSLSEKGFLRIDENGDALTGDAAELRTFATETEAYAFLGLPNAETLPASFAFLVDAGYWLLPKPADLGLVLFDALGAGGAFAKSPALQAVEARGAFHPGLSVLTSLLFTGGVLALAGHELATQDY